MIDLLSTNTAIHAKILYVHRHFHKQCFSITTVCMYACLFIMQDTFFVIFMQKVKNLTAFNAMNILFYFLL